MGPEDQLTQVIRDSAVRIVDGFYWYLKNPAQEETEHFRVFAEFNEIDEVTKIVVTESIEPLPPSRSDNVQGPYSLFEFKISKPFNAPGFLAYIAKTVADRGFPILLLSTYSRDYALIREDEAEEVRRAMCDAGFRFES